MKLKLTDRILLVLYAILGIALLLGGIGCWIWPDLLNTLNQAITWAGGFGVLSYVALGLLIVILLVWPVRLIMISCRREPKMDKSSVSIQHTEDGAVRVSVAAMDTLVKQAIAQTEGVVDLKTRIVNHEDSITVKIDMTLEADAHIPNITMRMQRSIKNFIEEFSGIAVREVEILVSAVKPVDRPVSAMAVPAIQSALKDVERKSEPIEAEVVAEPIEAQTEPIQEESKEPAGESPEEQANAETDKNGATEAPEGEPEHN